MTNNHHQTKTNTSELKTALSLFAGCGGDSLGMENASLNITGYVEINDMAIATHEFFSRIRN